MVESTDEINMDITSDKVLYSKPQLIYMDFTYINCIINIIMQKVELTLLQLLLCQVTPRIMLLESTETNSDNNENIGDSINDDSIYGDLTYIHLNPHCDIHEQSFRNVFRHNFFFFFNVTAVQL